MDFPERIPTGFVLLADTTYFLAELVRDIFQDFCNEVALGANVRVGCIATDIIYVIAHALDFGIHFCDDDVTANTIDTSFARLKHIHDDLDASVANDNANTKTIVDKVGSSTEIITKNGDDNRKLIIDNATTNKTEIINNDNSNRTLIINNDNANAMMLRDLILRTQIEADLAEADSATPVAWYLTPTTQTGKGGFLDLVGSIVTETLANIKAAGGSIGNAQSFLNDANAAKAAGDFKTAYALYRKAYKMAAK